MHTILRIKSLFDDSKIDEGDIKNLDKLKVDVTSDYSKGKINDKQYENMKNEISVFYQEIFRKKIDSWNKISDNVGVKKLDIIMAQMEDAYAKGKLNELHYTLLKDRASGDKNNQ